MNNTKSEAKIQTWLSQIETGHIECTQAVCIYYISMHPGVTLYELREALNIPHQTLTAAISKLMDVGAVAYQGLKRQGAKMNPYSQLIYVSNKADREKLRAQRDDDKFNAWLKQAEKYKDRAIVTCINSEHVNVNNN